MRPQTRALRIPSSACCSLSALLTGYMCARAARRFLTRTAASSGIVETLGRLPQLYRLWVNSGGRQSFRLRLVHGRDSTLPSALRVSCLEPTLARTFSHPTKESDSIDFDPGFPYRGCPGPLLPNELVGKFLPTEAYSFHAELGDAGLHFRYFEPFIHSRIELSDDRFRGSSRSKQAEPNVSWHSGDSAFRHCRRVWKLWPSRLAGHGHRSQPSFFDEAGGAPLLNSCRSESDRPTNRRSRVQRPCTERTRYWCRSARETFRGRCGGRCQWSRRT